MYSVELHRMRACVRGRPKLCVYSPFLSKYCGCTALASPRFVSPRRTVLGERRVGLFALRTIRAGEELTIDYKYARGSSAAGGNGAKVKQACYCGTLLGRQLQSDRDGVGVCER